MRRKIYLASAAIALSMWSSAVLPSSDSTCLPSFKLTHRDLSGCDNMAMMGPGNDTRVNMMLLLMDRYPARYSKFAGYDHPLSDDDYEVSLGMQGHSLFSWDRLSNNFFSEPKSAEGNGDSYGSNDYYGSRCVSNTAGAIAFASAVTASKLKPDERSALIAQRQAMQPQCNTPAQLDEFSNATRAISSGTGKAFVAYLGGAQEFYNGNYADAALLFLAAQKSDNGWLQEAGTYMAGRVQLNLAQVDAYSEWGDLEAGKANKAALASAEAGFKAYLKAYPSGQYAASARGLLRRVYWLNGDKARLAAEYTALLAAPDARATGLTDADLLQEMDLKLLPGLDAGQVSDPMLLAVLDLQRMRYDAGSDSHNSEEALTAAELQGQKKYFGSNADLFDYLQATHAFFVTKKPADVLKIIPDAAKQDKFTYLQFSRQLLRGMALDAVKDRNARGFWMQMLSGAKQPYQRAAVELGLASNLERNNALALVFDPATQITDNAIREILLQYSAGPALLKQQATDSKASAHERDVAMFTLLYKQLTRGAYADFANQVKAVPAKATAEASYYYQLREAENVPLGMFRGGASKTGYVCPAISQTAATLSTAPKNTSALLCLGDFVRDKGFDAYTLDQKPEKDELGGVLDMFPGTTFARLDVYKQLIAAPTTPANDKAYALYRAVNCYAPSGGNSCNGTDVPQSQRKAWFNQLKQSYPQSTWAKSLKYYW